MILSLEMRPLLSSAILTLIDLDLDLAQPLHIRILAPRELGICSGDPDHVQAKKTVLMGIRWPEQEPELVFEEEDKNILPITVLNSNSICLRISLPRTLDPDGLSNLFLGPKSWSLALTWPKSVQKGITDEDKKANIVCSKCNFVLSDANLRFNRCLPLPSIFWREFSQEWFCGCCEGNHDKSDSQSGQKNKELITNKMEPRPGDILYAPGFICVNADLLKIDKEPVLNCSNCQSNIGFQQKNCSQLWQHSVSVIDSAVNEDKPPSLSLRQTFLDMLNGILSESPEKNIKLYFTSEGDTLHLWIMEQMIRFYTNDESSADPLKLTRRENTRKIMFKLLSKDDIAWKTDIHSQEVSVPRDVYEAGLKELEAGEKWVPKMDMKSDFRLTYLME